MHLLPQLADSQPELPFLPGTKAAALEMPSGRLDAAALEELQQFERRQVGVLSLPELHDRTSRRSRSTARARWLLTVPVARPN